MKNSTIIIGSNNMNDLEVVFAKYNGIGAVREVETKKVVEVFSDYITDIEEMASRYAKKYRDLGHNVTIKELKPREKSRGQQ